MLKQVEPVQQTKVIRVLIVEDYKLTRMGLVSILKPVEEIEVVGEAEDGEKGVKLVEQVHPDVVLMDLGLPGLNGIEATHKIKAFDENIKVIVYTSHEREEEVIAALGAGANAYCLKDNAPSSLVDTIKVVAEGAAWLDPAIANVALKIFQKGPYGNMPAEETAEKKPSRGSDTVQLTEREQEVLKLLVEGKSNTEIAKVLIISVHTAKAHVCNILQKLSVHDRVQAAVKAIRDGLV
jgi:DNA-binding NarL/FixJ family response regulator